MNKNQKICIGLIILLFGIFSLTQLFKGTSYVVLKVINPFEIVIDKNSNGLIDDNETFYIEPHYQYMSKDSKSESPNINIDENTKYVLSYLTEKFTNDVLFDKKVEIKTIKGQKCIFVSGDNYTNILSKSGYFFKDNIPLNSSMYNKRLEHIKKTDYKIYNAKSNKYHNIDCKYGRKAHNIVLLAKYQLPKGAKPCKYCLGDKTRKSPKISSNSKSVPKLTYSSGAIKFFLTDYTTNLIPNRNGNTEISKELIRQIELAKTSIDIAIYGYDKVPKIENAIKRAIARGVRVRLVYDIDSTNKNIYANTFEFANIIKNSVCDRADTSIQNKTQYTNSIMHNKFYVFDNAVVITGSTNLSFTDMSDFNANSAVLIRSKQIASIYTSEFEQMYNNRFHNRKQNIPNKTNIQLGPATVSVYFSPQDKIIQTAIVPLINKARRYIYSPVFVITDYNIANALINAKKRGVDVRLIVDATNAKSNYSKHKLLRENGVLVKTENYAGKMHSKSIIIDDKYTISGSMNFSRSGENKNDENMVIIQDSGLANFYRLYFLYLWNKIGKFWLSHDVSAESIYSIGSCSDGIDNDYDGKTDMEDEGCKAHLKK